MVQKLPDSILVQVLNYVLVWDSPIDTHRAERTEEEATQRQRNIQRYGDYLSVVTRKDLAPLSVNHRFRHCAICSFWSKNDFRISGGSVGGSELRTEFMEIQPPAIRGLIRNLSIELSFGDFRNIPSLPEHWCSQMRPVFEHKGLVGNPFFALKFRIDPDRRYPEPLYCHMLWDDRVIRVFRRTICGSFPELSGVAIEICSMNQTFYCVRHAPPGLLLSLAPHCPALDDEPEQSGQEEGICSESDSGLFVPM